MSAAWWRGAGPNGIAWRFECRAKLSITAIWRIPQAQPIARELSLLPAVVRDENVVGLDIAVHDVVRMQVLQPVPVRAQSRKASSGRRE